MPKTVLITLTTAGPDTGPFDLYCVDSLGNIIGPPFENNVPKAALVAGYVSILVPDACEIIRVKSDNLLCTNYIDLTLPTTTTTTSTTSTSTTSTSSTTTTTTLNLTTSTSSTTTTTTQQPTTTSTTSSTTSTTSSTTTSTTSTTTTTTAEPTTTSTSTTSTTSTTSSTTSTTSEPEPICQCYELLNETGGLLSYNYTACNGNLIVAQPINGGQVINVCARIGTVTADPGVTIISSLVLCIDNAGCNP